MTCGAAAVLVVEVAEETMVGAVAVVLLAVIAVAVIGTILDVGRIALLLLQAEGGRGAATIGIGVGCFGRIIRVEGPLVVPSFLSGKELPGSFTAPPPPLESAGALEDGGGGVEAGLFLGFGH